MQANLGLVDKPEVDVELTGERHGLAEIATMTNGQMYFNGICLKAWLENEFYALAQFGSKQNSKLLNPWVGPSTQWCRGQHRTAFRSPTRTVEGSVTWTSTSWISLS